jgi:hypothetical protein
MGNCGLTNQGSSLHNRQDDPYSGPQLPELYSSRIVCFHGVPKRIVPDIGTQFISKLWKRLHETLDTHLNFSSAYYPYPNEQTKRVNQVLKNMLRSCAL